VGASIPDLLAEHRETLVQWGKESERLDERGAVRRANKLFEDTHTQFKVLRESEEGRAGIAALMHDPNPYVASVAAAHSLLWTPDAAATALQAMEQSEDVPWQVQVSAKYIARGVARRAVVLRLVGPSGGRNHGLGQRPLS
jgi:hypothetical protein